MIVPGRTTGLPLLGERVGMRAIGASNKPCCSRACAHPILLWLLVLIIVPSGCTTKSKANAAARAAYSAGQLQATERILQSRNSVTIFGPVRNPLVPWTQDLTLAKALVAS